MAWRGKSPTSSCIGHTEYNSKNCLLLPWSYKHHGWKIAHFFVYHLRVIIYYICFIFSSLGEYLKSIVILSKYFPNSDWHTHNSPQPVTDDQIWKNFVYSEEMTSQIAKNAACYSLRHRYREDLGTRLSFEKRNGGYFTRFKSKNYSWN